VSPEERDRQVRAAAFVFLTRQVELHGEVLSIEVLRRGFDFQGLRVPLVGPQGIFKPAVIPTGIPLSITTVPVVEGKRRPYEDEVDEEGLLLYRYRGTDSQHHENVGLRRAMIDQVPLVYFHGILPGQYRPEWPVFVVEDDPASLTFTVAVDDPAALRPDLAPAVVDEARRRYVTRLARQRLHQLAFRQRVLRAYSGACAICRLRHQELLDAAHILPDSHPLGEPIVPNGLALCRLHHAAFDRHILGVRPDLIIEVRGDVLAETDGPMLVHGLQDAHGGSLIVPRRPGDRPRPDLVAERYEIFKAAS
jgi:putative restriction endonuclease